ncbi:MAG: alpha/beta fold hydrolase [Deltaproteobacteria bacterium]|nr:alpha/beta fold hydrolase [Deltaproteobacteria bacterium]
MNGIGQQTSSLAPLARAVFDRGANVIAPRLPRHGGDGRYGDLSFLSYQELLQWCRYWCHLVQSLGDKSYIIGVSLGAILALLSGYVCSGHTIFAFQPPLGFRGLKPGYN